MFAELAIVAKTVPSERIRIYFKRHGTFPELSDVVFAPAFGFVRVSQPSR